MTTGQKLLVSHGLGMKTEEQEASDFKAQSNAPGTHSLFHFSTNHGTLSEAKLLLKCILFYSF